MKRARAILFTVLAFGLSAHGQNKPRIFVTDEPIHEGNLIVRGDAAAAHIEGGANARTVEIQADLVKFCPGVTVTNRSEAADFTLLFRRAGGKRSAMFAFGGLTGLALSSASKVDGASLFDVNGDLITATKQRTVERAISEVCTHIPMTVARRTIPIPAALAPPSAVEAPALPQPVPVSASVTPILTPTPVQARIEPPLCLASIIAANGDEVCTKYAQR